MARAWVGGQYADNGAYPRELPERIEYNGFPYSFTRRQYLRYESSAQGNRYELSWSFGPYPDFPHSTQFSTFFRGAVVEFPRKFASPASRKLPKRCVV